VEIGSVSSSCSNNSSISIPHFRYSIKLIAYLQQRRRQGRGEMKARIPLSFSIVILYLPPTTVTTTYSVASRNKIPQEVERTHTKTCLTHLPLSLSLSYLLPLARRRGRIDCEGNVFLYIYLYHTPHDKYLLSLSLLSLHCQLKGAYERRGKFENFTTIPFDNCCITIRRKYL
jgi:hypothetical protein